MKIVNSTLALMLSVALVPLCLHGLSAHAADAVAPTDAELVQKVEAALAAEPSLKNQKIKVAAKSGEVKLTGVVSDQQLMVTAGHVSEGIAGVKFVLNEIDNEEYLREQAAKKSTQ